MSDDIRRLGADGSPATDDQLLEWYSVADRSVPWLRVNFVTSADGAVTHDGLSGGLGTPADKRVFELLRWLCDVIIVGGGTVRAEGYRGMRLSDAAENWRLSNGMSAQPAFAVVSASLNLDPAIFAGSLMRPLVLTVRSAPAERRRALAGVAEVIDCGEAEVDTRLMGQELAARGLIQLHSEGGPGLFDTMLEQGTVDELCLTLSPLLVGGGARRISAARLPDGLPLRLAHTLAAGDGTLLLRYLRA